LVDIYNFISLKYMLPVGGEDLDMIEGDIELALAGPDEKEVRLLGDKEGCPPHPGEIIYKDNASAICRRFNWREADRTKLTGKTRNCILVIESLPPSGIEELNAAAGELASHIQVNCGGNQAVFVLSKENSSIAF